METHIDENLVETNTPDTNNSMYIDFIKIYTPVLVFLAERSGAVNITILLDKIRSGTQTEDNVNAIQQWMELTETENALAELTQDEINDMINKAKLNTQNTPEIRLYEDAIGSPDKHGVSVISTGKRQKCLITYENIKPTNTCITLNNQTYTVNAFRTYYSMEKDKKKNDPDYVMVTPTRNPITAKEERILDQFFTSLDKSVPATRKRKSKIKLGGTKKHSKSKSKSKSKNSTKTRRKYKFRNRRQ